MNFNKSPLLMLSLYSSLASASNLESPTPKKLKIHTYRNNGAVTLGKRSKSLKRRSNNRKTKRRAHYA